MDISDHLTTTDFSSIVSIFRGVRRAKVWSGRSVSL